jgi:hypothetical protein
VNLIVAAISLNRTGEFFLIFIIVGGVIGVSSLFLMTSKPQTRPTPQVIMNIRDEGIYQGQSLQIQCVEKTPRITYLEQTIKCIAVEKEQKTLVFMETFELVVTDVTFTDTAGDGSGDGMIVVSFVNSGTVDGEFVQVQFNGVTQTGNWELTSGEDKIGVGSGESKIETCYTYAVQITVDWTPGNNYRIEFFTTDGDSAGSFTCTA